jgi:hypothetical protein
MAVGTKLESRMKYRVKRTSSGVFLRGDFLDLSDYDQVGRALADLVRKGILIKLGYGLYARAKVSSLTGKRVPEKSLPSLAVEAMGKLGVKVAPTRAEKDYNAGVSTQVPTGRLVAVKSRISRKIGYGGKYINYERAA